LKFDLSPYLLVIRASKQRMDIREFYAVGRLASSYDIGYETRRHALEELIIQGLVVIDGSRLSLGVLGNSSWLVSNLELGSLEAWEIVDSFPNRSRKFDPDLELLKKIGLSGELFVMEQITRFLPEALHDRIRHESLKNDLAGFDITAPSTIRTEIQNFLEVKTSTRPGNHLTFFLSRGEFEAAKSSKNWFIVLVQATGNEMNLFGYLEGSSLLSYFPRDTADGFSWTVTRGILSKDDLRIGWP